MKRGFSTVEIIIALAIISIVFSGVIVTQFSNQYWVEAAQTNDEALYKAKAALEDLRATASQEFAAATSTLAHIDMDTTCAQGGLCYVIEKRVSDISLCAKYAQASALWAPGGYSTSSVALATVLTSGGRAAALGGDCLLAAPQGEWAGIAASASSDVAGAAVALDVLDSTAYVVTEQAPYLYIYKNNLLVSFTNGFSVSDPVNAIDVARDSANGHVYAYLAIASTTGQFAVVDVTNPAAPTEVARVALAGVSGSAPQGWRLMYWDKRVYITTRNTAGPELHIFDVRTPTAPVELGNGLNLNTSAYAIAVHDVRVGASIKRVAYLATTRDTGELEVVDVSDPFALSIVTIIDLDDSGCSLSDKPDGSTLEIIGSLLYVGREHSASCPTLTSLYAFDVSNPFNPSLKASGVTPGAVIGLKASAGKLYVYASTQAAPENTTLLDVSGSAVYLAQRAGRELEIWDADPAHFVLLPTVPVGTAKLQLFVSQ